MLLIVGWSAVVVWLNSRPRHQTRTFHGVEYGWPWTLAGSRHLYDPVDAIPRYRPELTFNYRALAANIAIGLLTVAILTLASKYLLHGLVAAQRAYAGKPPPHNEEGPSKSN